jgi:hypothetical protein
MIFILVMVKLKADKREDKKEDKKEEKREEKNTERRYNNINNNNNNNNNNVKICNTKERINDIFDFEKDIIEKDANIGSILNKNNGRIVDRAERIQNPIQNFGSPNKIKSYNDPLESMKNDLIIENKYLEKDKLKPNLMSIGEIVQSNDLHSIKETKDTSLFGKLNFNFIIIAYKSYNII